MTFWSNLKAIFNNLPLILSDTDDPRCVSLTRVLIFILTTFAIQQYYYALYVKPELLPVVSQYSLDILKVVIGLVVANVTKRIITVVGEVNKC
jgi:hypothetical protein